MYIYRFLFCAHFIIFYYGFYAILVLLFWADDIQKNDSRCWVDVFMSSV